MGLPQPSGTGSKAVLARLYCSTMSRSQEIIHVFTNRCASIVRQLDSQTLLHKIEKKNEIKYTFMLFESLCTVCISMCSSLI